MEIRKLIESTSYNFTFSYHSHILISLLRRRLLNLDPATETATKTCPQIVSSLKMDCPGALPSRVSLPLACNLEVHSTNLPDSKS
jgi:hypothetical protein